MAPRRRAQSTGFLVAEMALPSCSSSYVVALLVVAVYAADTALKPDSTGEQGSGLGEGSGRGLQLQVSYNTYPTDTAKLKINLLVGNQYNFLFTRT